MCRHLAAVVESATSPPARRQVLVVFEGRDTAGKGGIISRISSAVPTRVCRVVALPAPTERQKTQWFFQRYAEQLPAGGELVIFDRSWYNRAGVERVMGFATHEEVELFYRRGLSPPALAAALRFTHIQVAVRLRILCSLAGRGDRRRALLECVWLGLWCSVSSTLSV